jgi:protein TonB
MKKPVCIAIAAMAVIAAAALPASAQDPAAQVPTEHYRIEVTAVVPPQSVSQPLPRYYDEAQKLNIEGTAVVKGVIDYDGRVKDVEVVSGHPTLAFAARQAVARWRYQPARSVDGVVRMDLTVYVNFHLRPPADAGAAGQASVAAVAVVTPTAG